MRRMNRMPETYFGRTNEEWYEEMRDVAHEDAPQARVPVAW